MKPLTAHVRFLLIRYVGYLSVRSRIPDSYAALISIVEFELFNSAQLKAIIPAGSSVKVTTLKWTLRS